MISLSYSITSYPVTNTKISIKEGSIGVSSIRFWSVVLGVGWELEEDLLTSIVNLRKIKNFDIYVDIDMT